MGVHRTCGEPDEIGLTPMGVKLNGSGHVPRDVNTRLPSRVEDEWHLFAHRSGKNFRVGMFLDFASPSTRTEGPHGAYAYVQMSGRNRIDPHWGGVERLVTRTSGSSGSPAPSCCERPYLSSARRERPG